MPLCPLGEWRSLNWCCCSCDCRIEMRCWLSREWGGFNFGKSFEKHGVLKTMAQRSMGSLSFSPCPYEIA